MKTYLSLLAFFLPAYTSAAEMALIPTSMFEKFRTGNFTWIDIINFLLHLIQVLLQVAATVAVILVMYGGFQIIFGTISDDKESGKKTVKYSLFGFSVAVLAWSLVDIVVAFLTSSG